MSGRVGSGGSLMLANPGEAWNKAWSDPDLPRGALRAVRRDLAMGPSLTPVNVKNRPAGLRAMVPRRHTRPTFNPPQSAGTIYEYGGCKYNSYNRTARSTVPDGERIARSTTSQIPRERRSTSYRLRQQRRSLEHDPEKWMPVFRKDHAPTKKLDHDPIRFDRIMV